MISFQENRKLLPPYITIWHILFYLIIAAFTVWLLLLFIWRTVPLDNFMQWCPFLYPAIYIIFFIGSLFNPSSELTILILILGVYFLLLLLPVIPVILSMYFKKWGRNLAFIALAMDLILNLFNPSWSIGIDFALMILIGIIFKKADEDAPIPPI